MPATLSTDQFTLYERDGILFPLRALTGEEAAKSLDACSDLERHLGGRPTPTELNQTHLHFRWAYDLATHPRVLDAVGSVIGPNIIAWATSIFSKHPHNPGFISWHQDATYWGLDSTQVVTAWIALSNSSVANGCMRVVAGSQKNEILPHNDTYAENNLLSRGQEVAADVKDVDATDVVLAPGEMSLHHVRIIHGSNANESDEKRVGFAIRYVTPAVSQTGFRPQAVLARGQDDYGHYDLVGPPAEGNFDVALAAHRESARKLLESVAEESA